MTDNQRIPWKRLYIEAAAIVASILLAFAIDAWWTERLDRVAEREELLRLYDEFSLNRERLDSWLEEGGLVYRERQSAIRVSDAVDAALKNGSQTALVHDVDVAAMLQTPTFEANIPVFESLVRSGRMEIIENRAVVNAISTWERELRGATDIEQRGVRFVYDHLVPALSTNNIRHILLNQFVINLIDQSAVTEIRVNVLIGNLSVQRFSQLDQIHRTLTRVRDAADQAMAAISEFLNK
jgi:hypothetical protein